MFSVGKSSEGVGQFAVEDGEARGASFRDRGLQEPAGVMEVMQNRSIRASRFATRKDVIIGRPR